MINRGDSAENEGRQTLGRDLRLLELIVDNIDDLIAVIDSQGRRVWNNAAYARVLGYSVESLAGSNSLIEVHPDDLPKVQGLCGIRCCLVVAGESNIDSAIDPGITFTLSHRDGYCRRAAIGNNCLW